jgi:hypothetical protein
MSLPTRGGSAASMETYLGQGVMARSVLHKMRRTVPA